MNTKAQNKYKENMKKLLLLLPLWLLPCLAAAQPQSVVWEMPSLNYDTTIVRHWQGDEYIVYSSSGTGPGIVSYHDNASGTTISATLPSNVIINDFRIAHDSVFAGGSFFSSSGKQGLLACFSINELLSGSVYFRALFLPSTQMIRLYMECFNLGNQVIITGATRLALYEYDGGTRIAFIADNHIADQATGYVEYYRVGYGDAAYLSGTSQWDLCSYHFNKDGIESYTDICTTDHKIVITAKSDDYNYQNLRFQVFDKTRDYAIAPPGPYSMRYGYTDHRALAKVMVTHLKNDDVAVAYHYSDGTKGGLAVKTIDVGGSTPTLINNLEIPEDTTYNLGWYMNDIRYDLPSDNLLVLNRIDDYLNGSKSYIFQIHSPYVSSPSCIVEACQLMEEMYSLDNFGNNRFIVSGKNLGSSSQGVLIETIGTSFTCGMTAKTSCHYVFPINTDDRERHHCTMWERAHPYYFSFDIPGTIYYETINQICFQP